MQPNMTYEYVLQDNFKVTKENEKSRNSARLFLPFSSPLARFCCLKTYERCKDMLEHYLFLI